MDYSEEGIEQIINAIDDYLNLRDDWIGSGSVKGPVSESEAEEAVFEITQKLGFLRENLIRFLAAEGALSREGALGSVEESFEEVKSLAKEKLIARDFNNLKKNVLDELERNILPNEQAQGEESSQKNEKLSVGPAELLTLDDMKLLKEWDDGSHAELAQIQRAMLLSSFENSKGESISFPEAQETLGSRTAFLAGIERSAFHGTAVQGAAGERVYFNSRRLFSLDKKNLKDQDEARQTAERHVSELEKEWRKSLRNEAGFSEGVAEKEYIVRDIEGEKRVWKMWGDSELSNFLYKSFLPNGKLKPQIINYFIDWLKAHKDDYVRLYHGTSSSNRESVLKKGILKTTARRRKSYQSSSGFAHLSRWPSMAKAFGEMNNYSDTDVWAVDVKIRDLKPDLDQLANKRQAGTLCGDSLAESLLLGNGARVAKTIQPWQIHRLEFEGEKKIVEAKRAAPDAAEKSREDSSFWQEETTCENFQKRLAMRAEKNAVSVAQMLLLGMSASEQKKFNAIVRSQGFKGPEDLAAWFERVRSGKRKFERKPAAKAKKRSGPEAGAGR